MLIEYSTISGVSYQGYIQLEFRTLWSMVEEWQFALGYQKFAESVGMLMREEDS